MRRRAITTAAAGGTIADALGRLDVQRWHWTGYMPKRTQVDESRRGALHRDRMTLCGREMARL